MYCVNGNSSWYSDCGPLFGGCPLLGVSVIGGFTVYINTAWEFNYSTTVQFTVFFLTSLQPLGS